MKNCFSTAYEIATRRFSSYARYLGVFHDDINHDIEFDPVEVVATTDEVDEIARTHPVVGGAYNFRTGNGYWPSGR